LYEIKIKGRKKSEYILSESQMHKRMITRGLEDSKLVIRNGKGLKKAEKGKAGNSEGVCGKEFAALVKILADAERIIGVLSRRGISFAEFVQAYYDPSKGGLPRFRILVDCGETEVFYEFDKYEKRLEKLKSAGESSGDEDEGEDDGVVGEELHEVARINEISERLDKQFGLKLEDFLLKADRAVSGEALPTKFQLVHGDETHEVASLGDVCSAVRQIGGAGIEIKRFKGLGEMNAEQLWDTTMNPETRTLLNVKLDDAGEADRLFSILMGNDVEKRRNFIRDHALEVQNLDV
jgi:DNA gyrase subunit B